MPTKLTMPQLGEGVTEATLIKWLKAVGDPVTENEPLLEVNTDKVDTEIGAPAAGVLLAALGKENEVVQVGSILAWVGQPGDAIPGEQASTQPAPAASRASAEPQPAAPAAPPAPSPARELGFISPVVSRMAAEHHLDLSQVPGTGMDGRITKNDVQRYLSQPQAAPAAPARPAPPQPPAPQLSASDTLIPHTVIRRSIAEHMLMSEHTAPHVSTIMEADLSRVLAHRQANKEAFARDGVNLTLTAYFMAASVAALKKYPIVNSSWTDQGVLVHKNINIGMATSLGEEGLIVPVIKGADSLSLLGLARSINDLASRARLKKLLPDEVKGGTFTITNHGITGSLFATPIINQPQSAILGVGALQKRAVVLSDANLGDVIAIRPMLYISLTFDHRILDGASADWFLAKVVESLQQDF